MKTRSTSCLLSSPSVYFPCVLKRTQAKTQNLTGYDGASFYSMLKNLALSLSGHFTIQRL